MSSNETVEANTLRKQYSFIYKDKEYDATEYAKKHPGGTIFLNHMADEKMDFTEYFRALHSKTALQILKTMPVIRKGLKESENSQKYAALKRKVKHLFQPNYFIEAVIVIATFMIFVAGSFTSNWLLGIILLGLAQNIAGWIGHSQCHNRDPIIYTCGGVFGGIVGGLSNQWWNQQHNLHHMFTNNMSKDEDIQHQYKRYLFQFLFLKWKYDSLVTEFGHKNFFFLIIHFLIVGNQRIWVTLIAWLISGFFTAVVLVGNHEKEQTFKDKIHLPFIEHQLITSRNYYYQSFLSMVLMGGMQYQSEHHLFPQIPFYKLPEAARIIDREFQQMGHKVKYGTII